jgi:hypothetical protein
MVISYQGVEFFKVQFGDTILAFNPISKESDFKQTRFGADIALISLNHPDFNGQENVERGDRMPFVISGPGEYEVGGVIVKGFLSSSNYGGKDRINTIYYVSLEGMNICFLGALNSTELSKEANEAIEEVDILFVPIGGEGALDPSDAYKLAVNLEPKVIIPMHYGEIGQKDALKMFLKEGGSTSVSPLDKLTIKKKDLEGKESEIVVLSPTNS